MYSIINLNLVHDKKQKEDLADDFCHVLSNFNLKLNNDGFQGTFRKRTLQSTY